MGTSTVKLQTHSDSQVLEITHLTTTSFSIYVKSDTMCAMGVFCHYVETWLQRFVADLQKLEDLAPGYAQLFDAEGNMLCFAMERLGHLTITGKIVHNGSRRQELVFGFTTDQTCLRPFTSDLKSAIERSYKSESETV